ncbi:MAG: D-glycero-alpha-D-manno-heptose-1,7-bisphosphate 7-phosphatase [Planctomycetota bacterium]
MDLEEMEGTGVSAGAPEALKLLAEAGFLLIVATNQSAIARGWLTEEGLEAVHAELRRLLEARGARIDAFYHCPHLPDGTVERYARSCRCRKPEPGLIERAARDWDVDLSRSYVVGDSPRDAEAGRRAGCATILLGGPAHSVAEASARDLQEAARMILQDDWAGRR